MSIGMLMSLFAPVGRFRELNDKMNKLKIKRANLSMLLFLLGISASTLTAQENHQHANPAAKIFRVMGLITFTAMIAYSMTDSMFGMTLHSMVYTMLLGISAGGLRHAELNPTPCTAGR